MALFSSLLGDQRILFGTALEHGEHRGVVLPGQEDEAGVQADGDRGHCQVERLRLCRQARCAGQRQRNGGRAQAEASGRREDADGEQRNQGGQQEDLAGGIGSAEPQRGNPAPGGAGRQVEPGEPAAPARNADFAARAGEKVEAGRHHEQFHGQHHRHPCPCLDRRRPQRRREDHGQQRHGRARGDLVQCEQPDEVVFELGLETGAIEQARADFAHAPLQRHALLPGADARDRLGRGSVAWNRVLSKLGHGTTARTLRSDPAQRRCKSLSSRLKRRANGSTRLPGSRAAREAIRDLVKRDAPPESPARSAVRLWLASLSAGMTGVFGVPGAPGPPTAARASSP